MTDVADRLALQDLMIRYGCSLDARDWEGLRTVFLPDARVQYQGGPWLEGFEAVRDTCDRALARFRITQHLLGNHRAVIDGDTAKTTTDLQAIHVADEPAGQLLHIVWGTYTDDVVRTPEGWRIKERILTTTATRTNAG